MSNSDVLFIVVGFGLCFIIGAGCGLLVNLRHVVASDRQALPVEVADEIDDLKRQIGDWSAWYSTHMPNCAALAQSNAAGRAALAEWTEAQSRRVEVTAEVTA